MKKNIFQTTAEDLVSDKFARKSYFYAIIIATLILIIVATLWRFIPTKVPLFYSMPWGEARLAEKWFLFYLSGASLGITALNIALSKLIDFDHILVVKALATASLGISMMMGISLFGILSSVL